MRFNCNVAAMLRRCFFRSYDAHLGVLKCSRRPWERRPSMTWMEVR
jgi:hypothetical protein